MRAPLRITKDYVEDISDPDDEDSQANYRYYAFEFDFGDRSYGGRIYVDTPEEASIQGPTVSSDERSHDDLRLIVQYLAETEGIETVKALAGSSAGYETIHPT
jgi:hypothetical protein